jgi:hypothetical protein
VDAVARSCSLGNCACASMVILQVRVLAAVTVALTGVPFLYTAMYFINSATSTIILESNAFLKKKWLIPIDWQITCDVSHFSSNPCCSWLVWIIKQI